MSMEISNSSLFQAECANCKKLKSEENSNKTSMLVWNSNMTDWKGRDTRRDQKVRFVYAYFYD